MKRISVLILLLVLPLAVLPACKGAGQQKNTLATPEETVKAYCDLDAKGVRLTSTTWKQVLPYIDWSEEAGYDRAVVIGGFRIANVNKRSDSSSSVQVEYQVLGTVTTGYAPLRKTENVTFIVNKGDLGWKISSPDTLPPHVGQDAMVAHLKETKKIEAAERLGKETK